MTRTQQTNLRIIPQLPIPVLVAPGTLYITLAEDNENFSCDTHLEVNLSMIDPSDNHVGTSHPTISREAETDIAKRPHLQFERDVLGPGPQGPQQPVIRTQHGGVRPSRCTNDPQ